MKREIPVFQYDDAWQILARGDRHNGLVIDAGSEEVMLRIEKTMSRLKVMGDDDRRFFWIWAQVNKREREWLQVLTATMKLVKMASRKSPPERFAFIVKRGNNKLLVSGLLLLSGLIIAANLCNVHCL